jgi:cell division protease FtsH
VPFSRFLQALDEGRVATVAIDEKMVVWQESADESAVRYRANRVPGVDDAAIVARLHEIGTEITGVPPRTSLGELLLFFMPLLFLGVLWFVILRRGAGQTAFLGFGRSRAKIFDASNAKVTFEDVAGVDQAVTELREVVDLLQRPERYTRVGAHIPKGALLVGPTGTGKTLLAQATAGEAGVPFFSISGADFVEMFVGVGAARVRDLFQQARAKAPCIIFIDEIDTIGRSRAGPRAPVTNEEREQTLNQLLVEMDGFDSSTGVIMMAATNRPDLLDPALLRPGRFDRVITVDPPDLDGREAILKIHARHIRFAPDVDIRLFAARTPGFAGAQLANIINEAALLAVRHDREEVTLEDMDEAVDRVMAGLEQKNRALNPRELKIVAHHEMGHALVAMLLPNADPVHKVSVVPRGTAALGSTIQTPLEDRYLLTEGELRDRLTVMLGGRAAELVAFGEISTGAADDLQKATNLARRMTMEFGMGKQLGSMSLVETGIDAAGPAVHVQRPYSDDTAQRIDGEVQSIVDAALHRADALLRPREKTLRVLADELLTREVMDGKVLAARLSELEAGVVSVG